MEDILIQIIREASPTKHVELRKACKDVAVALEDDETLTAVEPCALREQVLAPLKLAVESKNAKLASFGVNGIEALLVDDRFHSTIESDDPEKWLPMQVLNVVESTPTLPEEIQVDVMKVLLTMTFSTVSCMNAKVVTKITELSFNTFLSTTRQNVRSFVVDILTRIVSVLYHRQRIRNQDPASPTSKLSLDTFGVSSQASVRMAVKATLTQLLSSVAEKLNDISEEQAEDAHSAIAEFTSKAVASDADGLVQDVVNILEYLCEKLKLCVSSPHARHTEALLLEGVYAILHNVPVAIRESVKFTDIVWQSLCPTMVQLLGNPMSDKSIVSQQGGGGGGAGGALHEEVGRGSGCSAAAPSIVAATGKTIFHISVELVRLLGNLKTLRPVLESLFHRMLLYHPPQHRVDCLKVMRELLRSPEMLLDLAGPTSMEKGNSGSTSQSKRRLYTDLSLLKLIIDSIQECCRCSETHVSEVTIDLINDLLSSVEQLSKGCGLSQSMVMEIHRQYREVEDVYSGVTVDVPSSPVLSPRGDKSQNGAAHPSEPVPSSAGEAGDSSDSEDDLEYSEDPGVAGHVMQDGMRMRKLPEDEAQKAWTSSQAHGQEEDEEDSLRSTGLIGKDFEELERKSAQTYTEKLLKFLPSLLNSPSVSEIDRLILEFSSKICETMCGKPSDSDSGLVPILNADGIYLATYYGLLLNLKLSRCGYYDSEEKSVPISEQQFMDEILGTGLLVYLSPIWLSEFYHQILDSNLLAQAGYIDTLDGSYVAIIEVLTDVDGLGSRKVGGQLMCAFRDTDDASSALSKKKLKSRDVNPLAAQSGMKFSRRVLHVCWDAILDVLSTVLNGKGAAGISNSLSLLIAGKEESRRAKEIICSCLDGLQKAARLSCVLGMQNRCGTIFAQVANASCVLEDLHKEERKSAKQVVGGRTTKVARLHAAHVLSIDVVLSIGLEMGSHSGDCWRHVYRCCAHVSELEHTHFSRSSNPKGLPNVKTETKAVEHPSSFDMDEGEYYNLAVVPTDPIAPSINVAELVKQSSEDGGVGWDGGGGGVLSSTKALQVLCGLSQQVDKLFEDAANKLNMKALASFLKELCISSQHQLATSQWFSGQGSVCTNALHLYRLGDVILRIVTSGRPLVHIMGAWSTVAPHLVEAACHKDRNISKKAVNCIHEFITTLFSQYEELPHFHFNESLCKPFENLLCLELCDGDAQDQVVCSICELVEGCATEIKSGWRPLFGALRAVKLEYTAVEEVNEARRRHVAAVLDVFEVFLNTDNPLVFANAAVDCILCLLKYVKGPGEFEEETDGDSDSGSEMGGGGADELAARDLCLPALQYLKRCCQILSRMWDMPACPVFSGAQRIKTNSVPRCVDPVIPNFDLETFQRPFAADRGQLTSSHVGREAVSATSSPADTPRPSSPSAPNKGHRTSSPLSNLSEHLKTEDQQADCRSLTSVDSGLGGNQSESPPSATKDQDPSRAKTKDAGDGQTKDGESYTETRSKTQPQSVSEMFGCTEEEVMRELTGFNAVPLEKLDNHTGVLHVWLLVLEGMASTVSTCPKNYQPQTLEMLFDLLRSAAQTPGPEFGMHCVNHLLLPMLQSWLRRGNQITGYWDTSTANFKQCAGFCTDLVVEYTVQFANVSECQRNVEFMLKQMFDVMTECIAQSSEAISRLGCSCIKHCIFSTGIILTERMWYIASICIRHAFDVTLYCLRQLMTPFEANSDNFYGDVGLVKVAVRKDSSGIECERLRQLAQQVFLLDSQRGTSAMIDYEVEEDRSYVFLIYPPHHEKSANPELIVTRVPFRSIVVGLLSHQLLVQMVGSLFLQGASHMVPMERNMLPSESIGHDTSHFDEDLVPDFIQESKLPGMLQYLSSRSSLTLLQCLQNSYRTAADFDSRPGLKFLIQKVSKADVASNMYKQAGISLTFYVHALMEICVHQDDMNVDSINEMITTQPTRERKSTIPASIIVDDPERKESIDDFEIAATQSWSANQCHMDVFVRKFKRAWDDICTLYVDMYLDKHPISKADEMSKSLLVFLVAEPEELPTLRREKPLHELLREKLREKQQRDADAAAAAGAAHGPYAMSAVAVQSEPLQGGQSPGAGGSPEGTDVNPTGATTPATTAVASPESSPHRTKPKRVAEDKVYNVVTGKTVKSMMSEYRKRKQAHTMPTFVRQTRSRPRPERKSSREILDDVDKEIDSQQKNSIMKDSDAHLASWIEMLVNLLQLFHQQSDARYRALLPAIFNCVNQLVCYCQDVHLREALGQWVFRIGKMYRLAPPGLSCEPVIQHR